MKLTKSQLRRIIKEEITAVVTESDYEETFGRAGLQKLAPMDHAGYSRRTDVEEADPTDRERIASVLASSEYAIDDAAIASILGIIEKSARRKSEDGPEEWDIDGNVTNDD